MTSMQITEDLDELASLDAKARALVAQQLRSKAVLLERLVPYIDRANTLGHTHARIHEVLRAAGVDMSFEVYRTTLKRVRKRGPGDPAEVRTSGSSEPKQAGSPEPNRPAVPVEQLGSDEPKEEDVKPTAGDVFEVRNALKQAQKVSEVDYRSRIRQNRK